LKTLFFLFSRSASWYCFE